jgi:hypothetical protein
MSQMGLKRKWLVLNGMPAMPLRAELSYDEISVRNQ